MAQPIGSGMSVEEFLEPDNLSKLAKEWVDRTQAQTSTPQVSVAEVITLLEECHGPIVVPASNPSVTEGYFVPLDPASPGKFLDPKSVPNKFSLVPLAINSNVLPELAEYQDLLQDTKRKKIKPKKEEQTDSVKTENILEDLGFKIDAVGHDDTQQVQSTDDGSDSEEEVEVAPLESSVAEQKIETVADIKKYIKEIAGVPIVKEQAQRMKRNKGKQKMKVQSWKSYTDLRGKQALEIDEAELESKLAETVSEIVQQDTNQPHTIDDRKERIKARAARRHNEAEGWYGMKRQIITPDARYELQALELRAFAGTDAPYYRGAKKEFELAKAESGFFQMGIIKDDGLTAGINAEAPLDTAPEPKKRRVKSLVKTLLDRR